MLRFRQVSRVEKDEKMQELNHVTTGISENEALYLNVNADRCQLAESSPRTDQ